MKNKFLYSLIVLAVTLFFAISVGGCGGPSGNLAEYTGNENNESNENNENQQGGSVTSETVLSLEHNMDTNGNDVPDFADFTNIPHYELDASYATASSGGMFSSSAMISAATLNITVPAMLTLSELRAQEEPNTFTVTLEANKEYTIEFSKNMAEALEAVTPRLKVYDPDNAELP